MARILIGNIKGPKGDTGLQGIQGEIGPVGPQGPLPTLVNNALATTPGVAALDAAMGKTLQDQLNTTNSNLAKLVFSGQANSVDFSVGTTNGNPSITIINSDGTKRRLYVDISAKQLLVHNLNSSNTITNTITFTGV